MGFEYRVFYEHWKFSRVMGFGLLFFEIEFIIMYNIITINVHDRYIIIDQNKIYHLGHSIKDLGKKVFSISESDSNLIPELLSNI